jgi:N-acetylglucosaminyldiphosphoundecaprenol N-acetyl-beta-D-mannosaminyltransferase
MMHWSPHDPSTPGRVSVTAPRRAELLSDLEQHFVQGKGFAVATLNLDHVVKLRSNPQFRASYLSQTHVTADGNPIVWLSRVAGQVVELVPGSELVDPVAAIAAAAGVPVALFGSTESALAAAADELTLRHPGLDVVLTLAPPMGFDPSGSQANDAIRAIRDSGARLCYLALGAPKQEIFAARALAALPEVGFLSIGAGLDFLAGTQRRAPWIFRRLAAEWLWRLAGNPARLAGRYASCLAILPGLTLAAVRARPDRTATDR